jgi:hypothetical protein
MWADWQHSGVDLGIGTFISDKLAQQLSISFSDCEPTHYKADGNPMVCNQRIPNLKWSCQGHTFESYVGILPLKYFDMILGEDWLEACSPMWVHWSKKLMKFTHQWQRIMLTGVTQEVTQCPSTSEAKLKGLLKRQAITHCLQF